MLKDTTPFPKFLWSPPSREAWIEIASVSIIWHTKSGRLPHGRRGLKYEVFSQLLQVVAVASLTGGVD